MFLPVSGYVKLSPEELAVIDHPSFQRLRRVRQLGLAHFVFPGGTHSRFEHSIGALHAARRILEAIRANARHGDTDKPSAQVWVSSSLDPSIEPFVRLGALLHDIGHLPFGHTLEDELHHLSKHDATQRLELVAMQPFPEFVPDARALAVAPPREGWSLAALVDALYARDATALDINLQPFDILKAIIGKEPKYNSPDYAEWRSKAALIADKIPLQVCRDIVGNTICADFLDYLFRDWHHLGKPAFEDQRLYHYMEVVEKVGEPKAFVINVGGGEKVRHDALTNILELLESRYKLAETVLFHRTKLAIIGLFDRCLLEIASLLQDAGIDQAEFKTELERQLLVTPDDGIFALLNELVTSSQLEESLRAEDAALAASSDTGKPELLTTSKAEGPLRMRLRFVRQLISRFRDRHVYTLAHKVRMGELPPPHSPSNREVLHLIDMYNVPANRLGFLRAVEALSRLSPGSLVMYCPPDGKMNAKVAEVKVFINGEVEAFSAYEERHKLGGLTCGALGAQLGRFHQLWSAQVFVEPTEVADWKDTEWQHFKAVLKKCFKAQGQNQTELLVERGEIETSLGALRARRSIAARSGTPDIDDRAAALKGYILPSGLPFELEVSS